MWESAIEVVMQKKTGAIHSHRWKKKIEILERKKLEENVGAFLADNFAKIQF